MFVFAALGPVEYRSWRGGRLVVVNDSRAHFASLNVDQKLDEFWRGVWEPLFNGFVIWL
jgi:hypothetical protein